MTDEMFRFGRSQEEIEALAKRCLLLEERIALLIYDMEKTRLSEAGAEVTRYWADRLRWVKDAG
jgi:hypothetical protein